MWFCTLFSCHCIKLRIKGHQTPIIKKNNKFHLKYPLKLAQFNRLRATYLYKVKSFKPFITPVTKYSWFKHVFNLIGTMPTLSTPASPSPLTEDGDHLLVELREFLQNVTQPSSGPRSRPYRHAQTAIRLLRHLPVAREAVLDYFST